MALLCVKVEVESSVKYICYLKKHLKNTYLPNHIFSLDAQIGDLYEQKPPKT